MLKASAPRQTTSLTSAALNLGFCLPQGKAVANTPVKTSHLLRLKRKNPLLLYRFRRGK
jgi:hypothetical protein